MQALLVALNAKYIHTGLSVRHLKHAAEADGRHQADIAEYTINHEPAQVLRALHEAYDHTRVLCFSCYLWNRAMVLDLAHRYHLLHPEIPIVLGGPEVSFDAPELLESSPWINMVLCGEGEASFPLLLDALETGAPLSRVPGLCWRSAEGICKNPPPKPLDLDLLAFPYPDLEQYPNQILYYEASRGCPFQCQYCLSSLEGRVRLRNLELVKADLTRFINARVHQVKFVDRTFNANRSFCRAIWQFLIDTDNGVTNFHFEIAAHLMDDATIELLSHARSGLFQLEIGVQSTNDDTLTAIRRGADTPTLFHWIRKLRALGNMHLHLDLIAGLPYEGLDSFEKSFNDVYELRPSQLQLGFLKVLKGSGLWKDAEKYGLVSQPGAPYEVLCTPWLPYDDLLRLKDAEEAVELFLNSGRYDNMIRHLLDREPSPFGFFLALGEFHRQVIGLSGMSKERSYELLWQFHCSRTPEPDPLLPWLCRLDIMTHERPRKFPAFADVPYPQEWRRQVQELFLSPRFCREILDFPEGTSLREMQRQVYAEVFPCDPLTGVWEPTLHLFFHQQRDTEGHAVRKVLPLARALSLLESK